MKIILENTDKLVSVQMGKGDAVPGRIWEGHTASGIYVQAIITRIATPAGPGTEQFERELKECRPPSRNDIFPPRMVI